MQEIEQSGTVNYFTFNKKIQEYPKQEQAWHTSLSAHPTLFHGNFCGKTRLQYQENNFTKYVSNQFNLMSSLSADFQEGARLHFTVCRKNACLRRGTHATDARLAKSRSWRCHCLFSLPASRTTTDGHWRSTASNLLLPYDAAVHGPLRLLSLNVNLCCMPLANYAGCPAAIRAALTIFVRQHKERGTGSWMSQPHQSPYQNFAGFVGQSLQEDEFESAFIKQ